jgi:hypothetical protein
MRLRYKLMVLTAVLALLSGCNFFAPEPAQQTLAAQHGLLGTEAAQGAETATAATDRLAATVEFAQTAVRQVEAQSTRIVATMFALGTPFVDARAITPPAPAEVQAAIDFTPAPVLVATPVISGAGSALGNVPLQQPPALTAITPEESEPEAPASGPRLSDLAMSTAVGANDCPTTTATTFPNTVSGLYVTAVANDISPNTTLVSRWRRDGVEVIFYEWTPGFAIAQGCIWFYMPAADVDFGPGNWSVELSINGAAAGTVAFTVTGPPAPAEGMDGTG